jgi:hypothetical protein
MNRQKFFSLLGRRNRPHKYRAIKVEEMIDGKLVRFASKMEHRRWKTLSWMLSAGVISELRRQPEYKIEVNGKKICSYFGDFSYMRDGKYVVEDVKGMKTPTYRLKKKLVEAIWGIEISEVTDA